MSLNNPCSITDLETYCKAVEYSEENDYVDVLYKETKRVGGEVDKGVISTVFKITKQHAVVDYLDMGCAIISFMAQPHDRKRNVFIDLVSGKIGVAQGVSEDMIPDKYRVEDLCNDLKQLLIQQNAI